MIRTLKKWASHTLWNQGPLLSFQALLLLWSARLPSSNPSSHQTSKTSPLQPCPFLPSLLSLHSGFLSFRKNPLFLIKTSWWDTQSRSSLLETDTLNICHLWVISHSSLGSQILLTLPSQCSQWPSRSRYSRTCSHRFRVLRMRCRSSPARKSPQWIDL